MCELPFFPQADSLSPHLISHLLSQTTGVETKIQWKTEFRLVLLTRGKIEC